MWEKLGTKAKDQQRPGVLWPCWWAPHCMALRVKGGTTVPSSESGADVCPCVWPLCVCADGVLLHICARVCVHCVYVHTHACICGACFYMYVHVCESPSRTRAHASAYPRVNACLRMCAHVCMSVCACVTNVHVCGECEHVCVKWVSPSSPGPSAFSHRWEHFPASAAFHPKGPQALYPTNISR